MVFDRNTVFALTEKSQKGQEPEQISRYTANRYMKCCPGICTPAISGRRKWWKTQYSGVMSLTI